MALSRLKIALTVAVLIPMIGLSLFLYITITYPNPNQLTPAPEETAIAANGTPAAPIDPHASTAARILGRGKLRVGIRFDLRPFGFLNRDGQLVGYDVDLAHELARRWLGDPNAVEFVQVSMADRILRLISGEVDLLIAGLEHRRERDAFIDFSQEYYVGGQTLLVRTGSGLEQLEHLQGRTVAVIQNSPAAENMHLLAEKARIQIDVLAFQEYPQALAALVSSQVDAISGDSVDLTLLAENTPGLQISGGRLTRMPYAIGVMQGDSSFRELVDATLQTIKKDGTYDAIYRRWFATDTPWLVELAPGESVITLNSLPKQLQQPERTRIQEVLNRGRLVVGVRTDLSPFGVREEGGRVSGFDIDLMRELAARWLGDENALDVVDGSVEQQVERLAAGQIDLIAAGLVRQATLANQMDFSQTYVVPPESAEPYALGLPQSDSMFRELVNVTLQEMKGDGSYDRIFNRWFGNQPAYAVAIAPGDADYLLLPGANHTQATLRVTDSGESAIGRIRKRNNLLIVGVSPETPPFAYTDGAGQIVGFDMDLLQAMAQQWGVTIQVMQVSTADHLERLAAGEVDLLVGALTHTKEREGRIEFSQTYFVSGQSLLVRRDGGVHSITDLGGRVVAVIQGSTSADQVQAHADANGVAITLQPFADYVAAVEALKAGQVQAVTANNGALIQYAQANPELAVVGGLFTQEPYAVGLPSGDSYFQQLVNATLQGLKLNGVYDSLYQRWFGAESQPFALETLPGGWPYTFTTSPTTLDQPVQSRVEQILGRRRLIAGVNFDFRPFGFLEQGGQVAGFDVDLLKEFAKRWLGDESALELLPVTTSNRMQVLLSNQVDLVAAAMTHSREGDELIDFSQTYFTDGPTILTRQGININTLGDLNGRVVAALQGSSALESLQGLVNALGISLSVLPFHEYSPALEALKAGQVDALAAAHSVLAQFARDNPELILVGDRLSNEPYALGIPNSDTRFRDLVNFTLQEMKQDGAYDYLLVKWFGDSTVAALESWPGQSYLHVNLVPMRRIPAGEFVRGSNVAFPDERPEQTIYLDEFFIDQFEVTNRQYARCVNAGRCTLPRLPRSVNFSGYYAQSIFGNYPAIWVSWQDAANYCQFVGKRLPSEAEWEKAARGGQNVIYPWGNDEPTTQTNFNYVQRDVAAVGSFPGDVSLYGVNDMAGNVREWVSDWYQWDYYPLAPISNPGGPATGVTRVLRGGSWNDVAVYVRTTVRKNYLPDSYDSNLGFRCASAAVSTQ
jgi:ABC-type amino acid transport substrate-binding protein